MVSRLKGLGIALAVIGLVFIAGGAYAYLKVQDGAKSLDAFSAAQNVTLNYNEEGLLVDRGETAGADAIMTLLTDDWGYAVNTAELDPNDPLVNTASEYMYQMATIAYHTLNGTQTIVLTEDKEYKGEVFPAGTYEFPVDGRYWTAFDRQHPIEGPARAQAWTGVAHGLIAELGVGTVTASTLQLGLGVAGVAGGLGGAFLLTGIGLVWATRPEEAALRITERATVRA